MLDRLISKNSPKIATTSNTLIVTCAIVILIAVLVFLELHIRRSIVHSRSNRNACRLRAFSFSNWLVPNEMNSQRNLTTEQIQSRAVNGEGP
jgi:hypothetical protein